MQGNDEKHVLGVLEKSSGFFEKLRAARRIGSCRYVRDYSEPLYFNPPSQAAAALRTAKLLGLQVQAQAGTGREEEARETFRDLLALAHSFKDEPLRLSQIVRMAVLGVALEAVHESVTRKTVKEELRAWLEVVPPPEAGEGAIALALSQARLAVLRTGLEWEIERVEKGRYPERPAAVDPLTGRPLGYDREAGRLSSSGLQGMTDLELTQGQLVWKLRHPPGM